LLMSPKLDPGGIENGLQNPSFNQLMWECGGDVGQKHENPHR
jgi:hypothetical protein